MPHRKYRLLIVEDNAIEAMNLQNALQDLGYQVCGHEFNGQAGAAAVKSLKPDLILMDIELMSRMDGINVARLIKERCDIDTVFVTAYADRRTLERIDASGALGLLIKPYSDEELSAVLVEALGQIHPATSTPPSPGLHRPHRP